MTIEEKYIELYNTPSDINEHLPILKHYADQCNHVTEMGVRGAVSLYAFLSSRAKKVVAIDIVEGYRPPEINKLQFICGDTTKIEIEQTDMLFIDTAHNYKQLSKELELHTGKVNKFIAFHDTETFGINGDDGGKGLIYAIDELLYENKAWKILYVTHRNNGLMIIGK